MKTPLDIPLENHDDIREELDELFESIEKSSDSIISENNEYTTGIYTHIKR